MLSPRLSRSFFLFGPRGTGKTTLPDFKRAEAFCLSRDSRRRKLGGVAVLPWRDGLRELGLS